MHPSLKALLQLQELDSRMIFLREAKEKRPRELDTDRRRLDEKKQVVDRIVKEMKRLRIDSDQRELDLKKNETEIAKLRTALNTASSNQEYQILRDQIARLDDSNSRIADDVLARLGEVEGLEKGKREAEGEVRGMQGEFEKKLEELRGILGNIDAELAQLGARRQACARDVPADHLALYDRVLQRHKDFALARVENQVCQGCYMSVTPQTLNLLLQDRELSQCRNCLRILYLD